MYYLPHILLYSILLTRGINTLICRYSIDLRPKPRMTILAITAKTLYIPYHLLLQYEYPYSVIMLAHCAIMSLTLGAGYLLSIRSTEDRVPYSKAREARLQVSSMNFELGH